MNLLELGCQNFCIIMSLKLALFHTMPTLISKIKTLNLLQMQVPSLLFRAILLFFVDVGKDPNTVDDATMFSNPLVVPIQNEKLEEASFNVNVSQRSLQRKINWKGGAHLNGSIHMGLLSVA